MRIRALVVGVIAAIAAGRAGAVADGVPLAPVVTQHVFGAAVGVGNTLMEDDGTVNFALRVGGSQATIPLNRMAPDATVVQAFLVWAGTFDPNAGVPLDRTVDFTLPNGAFFNDLSVDTPVAGETLSPLNRCVSRNHNLQGAVQPMFECRREVTFLLQQLGAGGAVGTYAVDDVNLLPGDCNNDPVRCQAAFGGWSIVVLWESPTEAVKRDLVVYDAFFALDEQGQAGFGGGFSSGIGPQFVMNGFTIGPTADGDLTFLGWEGDAQLGVPPQNLAGNPNRCNDGQCADFIQVKTNGNNTFTRLSDPGNRPGNLLNGSDNTGNGPHPGVDIDTFDIGPSGLNVLRAGDTSLTLQPGSGDGVADDGSGGSGELWLLGMTFLSVETFSPRFLNNDTEKVVLEPVAGAGETLHYILRVGNDGSASATNVRIRDQLPAGVTYVPASTTNTCGVASGDSGGTSPVLQGAGLNVGTLAINARCEVRFNVTIDNSVADGTLLQNFFTVAADGVPAILVGPANTVVQAASLGQPTKTVVVSGGGAPQPGSTLIYTIRTPNTGNRNAPNVVVTDLIPAQLQNLQIISIPPGATNNSTATTVDVRNISIPAGSSADVVFTAVVNPATTSGTVISNQGRVTQPSLAAPLLTDDPSTAAPRDPTVVTVTSAISLSGSSKSALDVNGGSLQPGDVLQFTVHVNKTGTSSSTIDIDDSLPQHTSGCTVVSAPPGGVANCNPGGANGTGRVTGSFTANTGTVTGDFVFRVTVDANTPDGFVVGNTAHITPEVDVAQAVDVSSPPLTVVARPDFVTSTKSVVDVNGGDPHPGDVLAYTITVVNSGSIAAANTVVTDVVSASLGALTPADGGVVSGAAPATITWSVGPLAVGASTTLHFTAKINAATADGTSISNSALIHADPPAQDFTTPPAIVVVKAGPVLAVNKSVADLGPPPFRPGDTVRYSIVVANGGDGAATNTVVRDTIDPSFASVVAAPGGRIVGGDVVFDASSTPALASVAPGATLTLTFDAKLATPLVNGTAVSNQARTTADQITTAVLSDDPATAAPNDPTRFTITSQAVLSLKKTFVDDNGGATLPGDTVTYTLAVDDTGDAPATNVSVTDPLDARLTFVGSPDGATVAAGTVSFPIVAAVVPGTTKSLRFTVRIAAPLANGTTIDNQASASSAAAASTVSDDPTTVAALDPTRITVVSRPVFDTATKIVTDLDGDGKFTPGQRVRYTIVVQNTGSENGTAVVVTDALPAALTNAAAGQGGVLSGGSGGGGTGAGPTVTWTLGTVAPGISTTLTVDANIVRPFGDAVNVDNQALVSGSNFATVPTDDPGTVAVDDPTRFVTTSKPHLTVTKTVQDLNTGAPQGTPVNPGDTLAYAITMKDDGDRDAANVTVTDVVDAHFTNIVPLDGGVVAGNTVTWAVANIALDASITVRFRADVRSPQSNGTLIPNQASAAPAEPGVPGAPFLSDDPTTAAPGDPTTVQVVSAADLSSTTMESTDPATSTAITVARPGDAVRYAIAVQNRGNDDARNAVISIDLPAQVDFVASSGGTFTAGGAFGSGTVRFDSAGVGALGDVPPTGGAGGGVAVALTLDVRLKNPLGDGQPVRAQASVNATGVVSPFHSDDPSTVAVGDPTVFDVVALRVEKDVSGGRVHAPDDIVTYTITLQSQGSIGVGATNFSDVIAASLTDVVPGPGLSFDAASSTISGSVGALAPGASAALTYSARVVSGTVNGTRVQNQAQLVGVDIGTVLSDDPTTAPFADPTVFTVDASPVLATSTKVATDVDGAPLLPGDSVRYVIVVKNTGAGSAADVRVTDVVDNRLSVTNVEDGGASAGGTVVWDQATTPALAVVGRGASVTLAFTARVSPNVTNGTAIPNQASLVTRDLPGATVTDDPGTAAAGDPTIVVVQAPQIAVKKRIVDPATGTSAPVATLAPGQAVEYRIEVDNTGGLPATGVVVNDTLPQGLTDVTVLDGGTDTAGLVSWTIPRVDPNTNVTVRVRATVDPLAVGGTVIANSAEASANEIGIPIRSDDPDTSAVNDATARTVVAFEQFTGTVMVFDAAHNAPIIAPVVPGQRVRVRVAFENDGNQVAQAVVLQVPLQPLRLVADSASDGGIIDAQTGVRWDASQTPKLLRMAHGDAVAFEFTATVASPIPDNIDIPIAGDITSASTTTPVIIGPAVLHTRSLPDLSATTKEVIDDDGGLVEPGDVLTYRITVLNDGGNVAPAVCVFDAVPGGTVYVAGSTKLRGQPILDVPPGTTTPCGGTSAGGGAGNAGRPPTEGGLSVGDLDAGRSALVEMKVRVTPSAPRGVRIDNQAILRSTGVPDAVSDNPNTPLILGDPTPVIVGGGASIIAAKLGAPSPVARGGAVRFDISVENVGTDPANDVVIEDAAPVGTHYVPSSLLVNGLPATDVVDRDDADITGGPGGSINLHRAVLEAGEGVSLSFSVIVDSGSVVVNQATVSSENAGHILTDGDPSVAGDQPTQIPVKNARAIVLDADTTRITDDNGGVLQAGDAVTVRATVRNLSLERAEVEAASVTLSANLVVDPAAIADTRFTIDTRRHAVVLKPNTLIELAPVAGETAGGAVDIVFPAKVSADAKTGDKVRATGDARATSHDGQVHGSADLGRASLTVGLLPGTAAIQGSLFLDGGAHDGVFQKASDVKVKGLSVLAFWRDDTTPVQTAITDDDGKYKLSPVPAGRYRLELRSPGGASFGSVEESEITSGEVRKRDIAVQPTGAVYVTGSEHAAEGSRVFLFVDDGDQDPNNDAQVEGRQLGVGQQGQEVSAQGLYRFDAPIGRYRIAVEPPDPLTAFPSAVVPVQKDPTNNPFGAEASTNAAGDVVDLALPKAGGATSYFLRFAVTPTSPQLQRNFIPVDPLKSELTVTKTANHKRASVGDIVSYTVDVDNRALSGVTQPEGGVEIVDALPFGFELVHNSYRLDKITRDARGQETRTKVEVKDHGGAVHVFGPFVLQPSASYQLAYNVVVGPGATPGEHQNHAKLRMAAGQVPLSQDAVASVVIVPDATFDLGTIRAKIYCDENGDGWQEPGDLGLPGVRLVADTGQWIDSDIEGKAHFSAIPAGEHLVKVDESTLPPGTTLTTPRAVFYMSAGLPMDVSFPARCAFVKLDNPEIVINDEAYQPEIATRPPKKMRVAGQATPPKLAIDGVDVPLPHVDLGVGIEGKDPQFAGAAGPNMPAVVDGALRPRLLLVPKIDGASAALAWQLTIDAVGTPAARLDLGTGAAATTPAPGTTSHDATTTSTGGTTSHTSDAPNAPGSAPHDATATSEAGTSSRDNTAHSEAGTPSPGVARRTVDRPAGEAARLPMDPFGGALDKIAGRDTKTAPVPATSEGAATDLVNPWGSSAKSAPKTDALLNPWSAKSVAVDASEKAQTVWIFAGRGPPPDRLLFDGRDPNSGARVLVEGQMYRATLSVGFAGGARATSAQRAFGVRAGALGNNVTAQSVDIDTEGGELFSATGKPTDRLKAWLGEHAAEWRGKKITVVVHTDQTAAAATTLTAHLAAAVKKVLLTFDLAERDVAEKGAGDAFPKVPNLSKKDRAKNRRVEIVVQQSEEVLPPIAAPVPVPSTVVISGANIGADDGTFASDLTVPADAAVSIDIGSASGAHVVIVRGDAPAVAAVEPKESPLVAVVWRPGEHRLLLAESEVSTSVLDVKIAQATRAADGSAVFTTSTPPLDVSSWSLRIFAEKDGAPAFSDDDSAIGSVARSIDGDGALPAEIKWDGNDSAGKRAPEKLRARLIVRTVSGDVGISPDVEVGAAPVEAPLKPHGKELIADPLDEKGALTPAAVDKLKALAASAKNATAVRIEVHTDDAGPRLERRTRTQSAAEVMKTILVAQGVPADRITALGMGSDEPIAPNIGKRLRAENRRAEITITAPPAAEVARVLDTVVAPSLTANGTTIVGKDGSYAGAAPAASSGEVVLDVRDGSGARASIHVRPHGSGEIWQGDPVAFNAWLAAVAPIEEEAAVAPVVGVVAVPNASVPNEPVATVPVERAPVEVAPAPLSAAYGAPLAQEEKPAPSPKRAPKAAPGSTLVPGTSSGVPASNVAAGAAGAVPGSSSGVPGSNVAAGAAGAAPASSSGAPGSKVAAGAAGAAPASSSDVPASNVAAGAASAAPGSPSGAPGSNVAAGAAGAAPGSSSGAPGSTTLPASLSTGPTATGAMASTGAANAVPPAGGVTPRPAWYPDVQSIAANTLVVDLPASTSLLKSDTLLVRGHTAPENRIKIGADEVTVEPDGSFVHVAKLPEGDSDLVVEATDPIGNVGRIKREVFVDTTGWFALLMADTAFGGDGADLGERTPFTSVKLGDTFLYGRGAAFVHGRWHGGWLFQNYDLTLDVDTRRWQDDVFDPELIDPERFFPVYGDSAVENLEATRSAFPIYLDFKADNSEVLVGQVRTDLQGGDLFRYQRARSGAQLTFDRGWTAPVDVPAYNAQHPADVASPEGDPWRTRVTTFVAGGGGQRHARVELLGTGSSVYFLRHERVVEGSERVNIIVRDAVTGMEIASTPQVRDVDYTIRYDEGRVMFKEPIGAFDDGEFIVNHNLGQVADANRVFVEVEYEHTEDDAFTGIGVGAQVKQTVLGHAEIGGGYVFESREGGQLGYQLGGGHLKLFLDDNTWIKAELLGSQSVDAGNFVSFDGGLTYSSLGQSLDQKDARIGRQTFSSERQGAAFKLDGNAQLGRYLGRKNNGDANLHAYVQQIQPGFFADASIVEQGETKWGTEAAWQVVDDGKLKLRYDGVVAQVPEIPVLTDGVVAPIPGLPGEPSTTDRILYRHIATLHYDHKVLPTVVVAGEYGFGYTYDSGTFGQSAIAQPSDFITNVVAAGVDWQVLERLTLGFKQEVVLTGDPNQLTSPLDHPISHVALKYALTDEVSLLGGTDFRWSGENQEHAGVQWSVNPDSRVYVAERVGVLPAPVTGTMGFSQSTVVGGESDLTPGSTAYAEYQLDGGFSGEQSRGIVGLRTAWRLPYGFGVNFGYERTMLVGGSVTTTEAGNVPPGAFTDGTFYAAPGANAGGAFLAGSGSRDALSAGLELKRGESVVASQRFELRYDNEDETRGGSDLLWLLSGSGAAFRVSPELSLLARYNIALAQNVTLQAREAYFEEGAFGVAYRPITHDWLSVLAKLSRRVDERPISLEAGTSDDYTAHAISIEPIVELPWKIQLVEKLALKHSLEKLEDTPDANAVTGLWINRVNLHTLAMLHALGLDTPIPGEIDLGLEYRVLAGFTYGTVKHGPLIEVQVAPIDYFRIGVGYNFTSFSDDELDSGKLDRSGFFVRAVGTF